jgi:hypothetical protein
MWSALYATHLQMWLTLAGYARAGYLADGAPMPLGMKTEILARVPIVQVLVTQGRALDALDMSGNLDIAIQLSRQWEAFKNLASRFGMLSAVDALTTPPWTQLQRVRDQLRRTDPELADILDRNIPDIGGFGIGAALGIALAIGGIVALRYLTK